MQLHQVHKNACYLWSWQVLLRGCSSVEFSTRWLLYLFMSSLGRKLFHTACIKASQMLSHEITRFIYFTFYPCHWSLIFFMSIFPSMVKEWSDFVFFFCTGPPCLKFGHCLLELSMLEASTVHNLLNLTYGFYSFTAFLDSSDTTLAFAVFGMTQVHTFPIAIFNVKNSLHKEEVLLCYNGKFPIMSYEI